LREIHQQLDDFKQQNLFVLMSCQPTSFKEATKEPHWVQAMNQEIDSIEKNKTWDLVDLPSHKKSIGVKWVYKTKLNEKGQIEKHKARLVAKGFSLHFSLLHNFWKILSRDVKFLENQF
jgi:hypothetical protein